MSKKGNMANKFSPNGMKIQSFDAASLSPRDQELILRGQNLFRTSAN